MTDASHAEPSISTRRGIAWGLAPPTEDSSVIVLNCPSGSYIDIRFALEGPSTEGPFWAFAGTAKSTPLHSSSGSSSAEGVSAGWQESIRGEWAHPIDSMGAFTVVDKADTVLMQNGDQMEFGTLENPDTGKIELFKEYWTVPAGSEDKYPCIRADYKEDGVLKGSVIRLGSWAQGIRQVAEKTVEVVRWRLEGKEWKEDSKSSSGAADNLPIAWVTEDGRKEGEKVVVKDREWVVAEVHVRS